MRGLHRLYPSPCQGWMLFFSIFFSFIRSTNIYGSLTVCLPLLQNTGIQQWIKQTKILSYTLMEKKRHTNKYRMVIDSKEDRLSRGWGWRGLELGKWGITWGSELLVVTDVNRRHNKVIALSRQSLVQGWKEGMETVQFTVWEPLLYSCKQGQGDSGRAGNMPSYLEPGCWRVLSCLLCSLTEPG